jgi:GH15 family glucan-1,4-alpha-glucosidase
MGGTDEYRAIGDYALLSDCHSAALVSRSGSVDWACLRRFDANSIFGRILDSRKGGFFEIAPAAPSAVRREYVGDSLVLETRFETDEGSVRLLDAFSMHEGGEHHPHHLLLRVVEGVAGDVGVDVRIEPRFDFGELRPLIRRHDTGAFSVVGGSTALVVSCDRRLDADRAGFALGAHMRVRAGERVRFAVESQLPSELDPQPHAAEDIDHRLDETVKWWHEWAARTVAAEPHSGPVRRSAVVLKGLTCGPTGAVVAAPTTSLPEHVGGERNWDYRYAWIRDAALVVAALAVAGQTAAARGFRDFLIRSAGGHPQDLRIMYGLDGSRHLPEHELELEGYRGSRPARVGNGAFQQMQHDVFGQLLDVAHLWHATHEPLAAHEWDFLRGVVDWACEIWTVPDQGIWEVRGQPRHFVHSKAMLWAAVDRGVRFVEEEGYDGDVERWRAAREDIREAIDTHGVRDGCFTQAYDTDEVDAALLELPIIGYVSASDARMFRTVDRIREDLAKGPDGFLLRYRADRVDDGLAGDEGTFMLCSFWLVDVLSMQGRIDEAERLFEALLATGNDVGLFAEQYDPDSGELLGNFPQAFTHMALINSAHQLACARGYGGRCREEPWSTADRIGERGRDA